LWEGGIHVPFIVQWKGRIPAGRVLDQPVIQVDCLPTALAAAGVAIKPEWKLDGVDLLPYMQGKTATPPHDALYWRFGIQYAVRQGPWKLVKAHIKNRPQLYHLEKDIGEKNNLADQEPEMMQSLQYLWDSWNAGNKSPRWIDERWDGDGTKGRKATKAAATRPGMALD
jgi:arylsulfatase A-like enzyme